MKELFYLVILTVSIKNVVGTADAIAGAEPIKEGQFPFFVQILIIDDNEIIGNYEIEFKRCGGTLIHPQWVLTAAHCFKKKRMIPVYMFKQDHVQAIMGSQKLSRLTDYNILSFRSVQNAYIHNKYLYKNVNGFDYFKNDVAVAQLKKYIIFNENIQIIKLPNAETKGVCSKGIIIGGGLVTWAGKTGRILKYAKVRARTIKQISKKPNIVSNTMFYSEINWYRGHPLAGDIGSPFVCSPKNEFIQYGIVSSYYNNSKKKTAITQYESVYKHLNFIERYVDLNFLNTSWYLSNFNIQKVRSSQSALYLDCNNLSILCLGISIILYNV